MSTGPPAATIVDKASDWADLIVIGVGEERRFEQLAAGPIAEEILEQATQPVLAVRPGEPPLQFRRILCPADHSTTSRRGL